MLEVKKNSLKWLAFTLSIIVGVVSLNGYAIELDQGDRAKFTKGSLHWVTLSELLPTQPVIAHDQVNYKLELFSKYPEKMYEGLCESYGASEYVLSWTEESTPANPESFICGGEIGDNTDDINTVIVGPNGKLYLTDGHHSFSTFFDMKQGGEALPVYVQVQENWSLEESENTFWDKLVKNNNSWPYLADGVMINYQDMPVSLGRDTLTNDPYRGLMYFARKIGWNKGDAASINYLEFHWASEFRSTIAFNDRDKRDPQRYLNKIEEISRALIAVNSDTTIGISDHTAKELGQKKKWDKKSDRALSTLLCKKGKLGKLGFALESKNIDVNCK